jgi:hypothetical protein
MSDLMGTTSILGEVSVIGGRFRRNLSGSRGQIGPASPGPLRWRLFSSAELPNLPSDGSIFGECVEECLAPALIVAGTAESVVEDPPGIGPQIAADVVAEEKMSQEEISSPGQERLRIRQLWGMIEAERMPADGQEGTFTLLGKESLMDEVGAGPDPQVPRVGYGLVTEENGGQHAERLRAVLLWTVAVQVGPAGPVSVRGNVQGDLDVVEPMVESVRPNELLCALESGRVAERGVCGGQAPRRQEVEMVPYRPGRRRLFGEDTVDFGVGGDQEVLRDDAPQDDVSVGGEITQLLTRPHDRPTVADTLDRFPRIFAGRAAGGGTSPMMTGKPSLLSKGAVVGIGRTPYGRASGRTPTALAAEAVQPPLERCRKGNGTTRSPVPVHGLYSIPSSGGLPTSGNSSRNAPWRTW